MICDRCGYRVGRNPFTHSCYAPIAPMTWDDAKSTPLVEIDAFFKSDELIAAVRKGEKEMHETVERVCNLFDQHIEAAFYSLVFDGVVPSRMTMLFEGGAYEKSIAVDGERACTVTGAINQDGDRYAFDIKTTWHGEWKRLGR